MVTALSPYTPKRRKLFFLALVSLSLLPITVAGLNRLVFPGPYYKGKPVTYWSECLRIRLHYTKDPYPTSALQRFFHSHGITCLDYNPHPDIDALMRGSPDALPVLRSLLDAEDSHVRARAASSLAKIGDRARKAIPDLFRMASCRADFEFSSALFAIDHLEHSIFVRDGIPLLVGQLNNPRNRMDAIWFLARLGPEAKPAMSQLVALVQQPIQPEVWRPSVVAATCHALMKIDPTNGRATAMPLLRCLLHSSVEAERVSAADTLGDIGPQATEAIPDLMAMQRDTPEVCRAARRALRHIHGVAAPDD